MKSITSKELREFDAQQRAAKIYELRHEMLQLRLRAVSEHVPSLATQRRALRKSVARALTIQNALNKVG
jgi:ribosomal protein L29